jgi:hypothetical protein
VWTLGLGSESEQWMGRRKRKMTGREPREVIAWIDRTPGESSPTQDDYDFADEVVDALAAEGYQIVIWPDKWDQP